MGRKEKSLVKNYEVWSNTLCEMFSRPVEERDSNYRQKFDAYFKFSFPYRREFMTSEKDPAITDIKKLYPYLFHKDQVFKEFDYIADKPNTFEMFSKNTELYAPEVIKRTSSSPFKETIETIIKKADEETKKWMEKAGSLLLLPRYMGDERKGMIIFNNELVPTNQEGRPHIVCDKDVAYGLQKEAVFRVVIEDTELCVVNNLIEAFFALIAAYYIFNTIYPTCCQNTFHCLEKLYVEYAEDADEVGVKTEELVSALEHYGRQKKERKNNSKS